MPHVPQDLLDDISRIRERLRLVEGRAQVRPALGVAGTAVLVGGAVTVAVPAVTDVSRILLTSQVDGGAPGWLRVSGRSAGVSFTIASSSAADTSTVAWLIT